MTAASPLHHTARRLLLGVASRITLRGSERRGGYGVGIGLPRLTAWTAWTASAAPEDNPSHPLLTSGLLPIGKPWKVPLTPFARLPTSCQRVPPRCQQGTPRVISRAKNAGLPTLPTLRLAAAGYSCSLSLFWITVLPQFSCLQVPSSLVVIFPLEVELGLIRFAVCFCFIVLNAILFGIGQHPQLAFFLFIL